jgi:hypothetical protein
LVSMTGSNHRICWLDYIVQQELKSCDGNSLRFLGGVSQPKRCRWKARPRKIAYRCEASSSASSMRSMICARVGLLAPLLKSSEGRGSPVFS